MYRYILKRLAMLIPVLIGVLLIIFILSEITPGDAARQLAGEFASEEDVEAIREQLGLNKPFLERFGRYVWGLITRLDLGTSYQTSQPVSSEIFARFPTTLLLALVSMLFAVGLGIPAGIISATRQYSLIDNISMVTALLGVSMPNFWQGLMNIIVFCLINDILKREVQITENRLLLERVKNETGMYRTISENYDKQKKREHEYKNQLALIAALASENRVDEINHYLKQYNHEIMQHTDFIDTNNVIVNAILNSKYQETREKCIVFVVKVNDLSDLRIKDEDIVLILSNLRYSNFFMLNI